MIRYSLTCEQDHSFDSWFQSAAAFDRLLDAGMVSCAMCGSSDVKKALMAPAVTTREEKPSLSTPKTEVEKALAEMQRRLETESEHVGLSFAAEARAIHEGESPKRSIWGEAKPEDARALIEDGIPVTPLPFRPRSRQN